MGKGHKKDGLDLFERRVGTSNLAGGCTLFTVLATPP